MNINSVLELADTSIPEWLNGLSDRDFHGLITGGFEDPARVQEKVLLEILRDAAATEIGQLFGFNTIKTIDEFRARLPLTEWADVEPYAERLAKGERDLIFRGPTTHFILTSGTSGNLPKLVPESQQGSLAKQAVSRFRRSRLQQIFSTFDRSALVLPLSNMSKASPTVAGIPVTFASGIALAQASASGKTPGMAFPLCVLRNSNNLARDYLILRFSLQQKNVGMVVGNNAGRFRHLVDFLQEHAQELIQDIHDGTVSATMTIDEAVRVEIGPYLVPAPERAAELRGILDGTGKLLPRDFWPTLKIMVFWLSGTVGHYVKDIEPLISPETIFYDAGYGASEARINIPMETGNPSGVLSIYTAFYEFIPQGDGTPILAHELEDGGRYEILLTTWSGLYRYKIQDMIEVRGFTGGTPNVFFYTKVGDVLNIAEEKVSASTVNDAIWDAARKLGVAATHVQIYPDVEKRRYICYLELSQSDEVDIELLALYTHEILLETSFAYEMMCVHQKLILPLRIVRMKTGWQNFLYQEWIAKTGSSTQVKLPIITDRPADREWAMDDKTGAGDA